MRFAVLGSYGRSNIGDEAIADGIAKMLRHIDPQCELVLFTHDQTAIAANHASYQVHQPMIASGIRSLWQQWSDRTWHKSVSILKSADWIIIGGGGIFHDHEVGQTGLNPLFIWWLRTILLRFLKKPILIWAVGIGPIKNPSSSFWLRGILKRAHTITVRDQASALLVQGYTDKPVTVIPDPVWSSLPKPKTTIDQGILGINIRDNQRYSLAQIEPMLYRAIDEVIAKYKIAKIVLLPFAFHQPDDRKVMQPLLPKLQDRYHLPVEISTAQSPDAIFATITACTFAITMRFHSYIFAQSAHVPCELLSYSSKTDEISRYSAGEYEQQQQDAKQFWQLILSKK